MEMIYNHCHNVLRLLTNIPLTASETKHDVYEFLYELPNNLRLTILGN